MKFEISENPTTENTSFIETEAKKIVKNFSPSIKGSTSVLKIMLDGKPFYHFSNKEFDSELASRDQSALIGSKRFYLGVKNNSMRTRMKLKSISM